MRYFVDERVGCIAVRDRKFTDPDYNGLHHDTEGVIQYWGGEHTEGYDCPTCGGKTRGHLVVREEDKTAAEKMCDKLNKKP